jgi:hypothetical protein
MAGKVTTFTREDGLYDWHLIGGNGEDMCGSMQGYTEENDAWEGFQRCVDALMDPETIVTKDNTIAEDEPVVEGEPA